LVELFIDFDETILAYVQESTGPAATASQSSILAALVEPEQDRLRVTILGTSNRPLYNGHLGTVFFAPIANTSTSSEVLFDLSQYQVTPPYILEHVTFGVGHPQSPLFIP
jgi:hypothetical protein